MLFRGEENGARGCGYRQPGEGGCLLCRKTQPPALRAVPVPSVRPRGSLRLDRFRQQPHLPWVEQPGLLRESEQSVVAGERFDAAFITKAMSNVLTKSSAGVRR